MSATKHDQVAKARYIREWAEARDDAEHAWLDWWCGEVLDAQPNAERINELVIALRYVAEIHYRLERRNLLDVVREMRAEPQP